MRTLLHGISLRRKLLFLQGISLIFTILSLIFILRIEYYGEIGSIAERSDQIAEQAASRAAQLYHEQETITLFPLLREANGTPNATMNVLLGNTEGPVLSYQEIRTLETEMMNSRQCAAWLGISTSALRTRVCEGTIPFHKKGGRLYFDRAEVEREYLAERREFDLRRERAARYAVIDRVGRPRPRE